MPTSTPTSFSALERQREIYIAGISGQRPILPVRPEQLQAAARQVMSKKAFAYVAGGAGAEATVSNNRSGFERWQIVPRMLQDVSAADLSTELFGQRLPAPLLLAPVGVLELAHPRADLAVGSAATKLGVPFIFSNQASVSMEETARVMQNGPRWFQLYWSKSNALVTSLVQRAEAAGCQAIVVTLDTTMLGWRPRDLDLAYLPFLQGKGIAQYISDPVFQQLIDDMDDAPPPQQRVTWQTIRSVVQLMRAYPGGFFTNLRSKRPLKAVRKFIDIYTNPALNWKDLAFLRQQTDLPILLKGILHPADAQMAINHGVDGLVVSNHGGRQVDGALASIDALPKIVEAVQGRIPVLLDSGVRTGADIFKALALGAQAVCIGRPYVYGLALAGAAGVEAVIRNLLADFELTMRLSGCRTLAEINASKLTQHV